MPKHPELTRLTAQISHLSVQLAQQSAAIETLTAKLCENAVALMFTKQELAEATERYDRSFDLYAVLRRSQGKMPATSCR
jgi:hypothetical protein